MTPDMIAGVASVVAGFSLTALMFRIQRELAIADANRKEGKLEKGGNWIPPADFMLIGAFLLSLLGGLLPTILYSGATKTPCWPSALSVAAVVLLAGYIPAILAHYNWIFGLYRETTQTNGWERTIVFFTALIAVYFASINLCSCLCHHATQ